MKQAANSSKSNNSKDQSGTINNSKHSKKQKGCKKKKAK